MPGPASVQRRGSANRCLPYAGLLELNSATAEQLSSMCGLPRDLAEEVVASRATLGRFLHVEDAVVYGQVGEE